MTIGQAIAFVMGASFGMMVLAILKAGDDDDRQ